MFPATPSKILSRETPSNTNADIHYYRFRGAGVMFTETTPMLATGTCMTLLPASESALPPSGEAGGSCRSGGLAATPTGVSMGVAAGLGIVKALSLCRRSVNDACPIRTPTTVTRWVRSTSGPAVQVQQRESQHTRRTAAGSSRTVSSGFGPCVRVFFVAYNSVPSPAQPSLLVATAILSGLSCCVDRSHFVGSRRLRRRLWPFSSCGFIATAWCRPTAVAGHLRCGREGGKVTQHSKLAMAEGEVQAVHFHVNTSRHDYWVAGRTALVIGSGRRTSRWLPGSERRRHEKGVVCELAHSREYRRGAIAELWFMARIRGELLVINCDLGPGYLLLGCPSVTR